MRIADLTVYDHFIKNMAKNRERFSETVDNLSSGKKLKRVSQDPADSAELLSLKERAGVKKNAVRILDRAKNRLQLTESILSQVQDVISLARENGIQAANNPGETGLDAIAEELKELRSELVRLANSRYEGRYIFAGSATLETPFDENGDYNGNSNLVEFSTQVSEPIPTNVPGDRDFQGGGNVFATLDSLIAAIEVGDFEAVSSETDNLQAIHAHVGEIITEIGTNVKRIEDIESSVESHVFDLETRASSLEDVDLPTAIVEMVQSQLSLDGTISFGKATLGRNILFDLLK
jgi:flagellar hook-associated protein 3 FlgL